MTKLGVNIDHIATLRQARQEGEPDPVYAAKICENAGADSVVAHLREDRRHINDNDIRELKKTLRCRFNLEMSMDANIVKLAASICPDIATLVPEKRQELTTEGGLDVIKQYTKIRKTVKILQKKNIEVSLFIDPIRQQIKRAKNAGVETVEIHTGKFDRAQNKAQEAKELKKIKDCAIYAKSLGLNVSAGHGLKYHNAKIIAKIPEIEEINIGHSIISQAVLSGLGNAVKEMLRVVQ